MGRSHTCTPSLWLVSCTRHPVWLMWVWLLVETGWKVSFSWDSFSESTFIHTLQCLFPLLCVQHAPRSCVYITFANVTNPMSILTALQRHKEFYHEKCNTKPEEEEEKNTYYQYQNMILMNVATQQRSTCPVTQDGPKSLCNISGQTPLACQASHHFACSDDDSLNLSNIWIINE